MNVLQVNPTNVYPPTGGGQHRSHGLVAGFPDAGDAVYRYCQGGHLSNYLSGTLSNAIQIDENYAEFQQLNPLFDLTRLPEAVGLPNVFLGKSLRLCRPSRLLNRIDWADVLLVEFPWQVPAVSDLAGETPVLFSSHNVEQERFESTDYGPLSEWVVSKVTAMEREAITRSTATVCTSERDADEYRSRYGAEGPFLVAPNGVPASQLGMSDKTRDLGAELRAEYRLGDSFVCLFVGTAYGPNAEAASLIVEMADAAQERALDVHFLVVGSVGESLDDTPENVTVTGFVDELAPYFAAADVGLNPVVSGSGTTIKFLDYLSNRLPVVTTPFGVRGFAIEDGTHALVSPVDEFLEAITRIRRDEELRHALTAAGFDYVRDNHTWEQISSDLRDQMVEFA